MAQNIEQSVSLNNGDVDVLKLNANTLAKISDDEIERRYEQTLPDFSDVLKCYSAKNRDGAFCFPHV